MSDVSTKTQAAEAIKGQGWLFILTAIPFFFASQILAYFLVSALSQITDISSAFYDFLFVCLAESLVVVFVLLVLRSNKISLSAIGLGRKPQWSDAGWAVGGFAAFYGFWVVVGLAISLIFPDVKLDSQQDVGFNNLTNAAGYIMAFIALVIFPPVAEEIVARGYLYSGLRSKLKYVPAMLITSALFGLAHIQGGHDFISVWGVTLDTFVLSIVLVTLREKTGALYACIAVHCLNNLVAYIVHFHG